MKRHASVEIQNQKIEMDKCLDTGKTRGLKCFQRYQTALREEAGPRIERLYAGYLKNFDTSTGLLVRADY